MSSLLHAYAPPTLDARPAVDVEDTGQICCMRARLQLWTRVLFHVDKYHSTSLSLSSRTFHFSELLLLRYLKSRTYLLFLVFAAIQALLLTSFLPESQAFGTRSFNIQLQKKLLQVLIPLRCLPPGPGTESYLVGTFLSPSPYLFCYRS